MAGIAIKDAPLVEKLKLEDKFPVSDGSFEPRAANFQQVKDLIGGGDVTKEELALKQDRIDDLDAIRKGASRGMTAIQEHQDISGKQDVIKDLDEIRQGARKGSTALQEHQDISGKADKDSLSKVAFSGSYNDLKNKPSIPSKVSELENDEGYLKHHQDLSGYATKGDLSDGLGKKQDVVTDLASIREGASKGATALQSVPSEYVTESELVGKGYATVSSVNAALGDKVDKVSGKQLSTEDFTAALKQKLEGLNNYDDTEVRELITKLRGDFDTLLNGDTSTAIDTFNNIVAFLEGIEDTQSLKSILAAIELQIAEVNSKIPTKTSQLTNDSGFLTEHQDLSSYLTKKDAASTYLGINATAKFAEKATQATKAVQDAAGRNFTTTYATKAELNKKQDTISDLETIRSGAAKGATALQEHQDISHLATKEEIPSQSAILEAVYPVGSIYMSMVETNPSVLFGFGTWEQVKGRFLLGADSSFKVGDTGGESSVTLTKEQTPAHTHTRGTMEIYGALTERPCTTSVEILNSKPDGAFVSTMKGDTPQWGVTVVTEGQSTHTNNLHEFRASRNWTGETSSVGSGAAHNNMPPYLVVYIWKRTA